MGLRLRDALLANLPELRYEPVEKRIRAGFGERTVVDTTRAMLVWEPLRVVPSYAVPVGDLAAELAPAREAEQVPDDAPQLAGRRVLDPSVPFGVHTAEGDPVTVRAGDRQAAGFRPADPALAGYVVLEFAAFDGWLEEDEPTVSHPRDPFHRIEIVHSSRHVRVEVDGQVLAESTRPYLLLESMLPVRYYLPPEDVRTELLEPSDKRTFCAYKGEASYWSAPGAPDVVWAYPAPLREAAEARGRLAFFNERVDHVVDGVRLERPITPWSR